MKIVAHVASLVSLVAIAAVVLALLSPAADGQSELRTSRADRKVEAPVDAQGNLHVPSSYRAAYEFLGAWAIGADKSVGSSELHDGRARAGHCSMCCAMNWSWPGQTNDPIAAMRGASLRLAAGTVTESHETAS